MSSVAVERSARTTEGGPARVSPGSLLARKRAKQAITAVTAYDYPTARLVEDAGIDITLVGDSLGMVVLGLPDTLRVTMRDMLHHARAVRRGLQRSMLVVDMPYGSYHVSVEQTVTNALRLVKNAGVQAVKIEGGAAMESRVRALLQAEIPVFGHIGLTPQAVNRMGGYRVQGRTEEAAARLLEDALVLESAGSAAIVLEGVPREVAAHITAHLNIPTIGIGAGPDCDGQILVWHDLFALSSSTPPRFVRQFADAGTLMRSALGAYRDAVEARTFPSDAESYHLRSPKDLHGQTPAPVHSSAPIL
jgi:3-methyl-2-oxobutanoate hydroxymethyltransferase